MTYIRKFWWYYVLIVGGAVALTLLLNRYAGLLPVWSAEQPDTLVVIDPGHGGEDGGAVSCTGVYESRLNLEISLRLDDMLHLLGMETKLTRCDDVSVSTEGETVAQRKVSDIRNRVRFVNALPGALLISVHQNQFAQEQYRGAQVFYAPGSEQLAQQLQQQLTAQVDERNHRECKPAKDIYLMEHAAIPALLVECGFLSNAEEEALLRSEAYQKKLAACIAGTVLRFTEEEYESQNCVSLHELRE